MKSIIADLESSSSSHSSRSNPVIDNEVTESEQQIPSNSNIRIIRPRSLRRRGNTVTIEGPTGAPPLGTVSMAGAAGGGPAAWAAAAFGRGDNRKVSFKNY